MEKNTKPSLPLNSIDTIRLLNLIARNYYHNDDGTFHHEAYLRDCFKCLLTFFSTELYVGEPDKRENAFLFAALTYKKEDSPRIELVKLDDGLGYYFNKDAEIELAALFNPVIEELYDAIYKKKSMSVTEMLLKDKRRGKDLFLYSGKPYETPVDPSNDDVDARIAFFRLSDLAFLADESVEKFCKSNAKQIGEFKKSLNKNSEIVVADSEHDSEQQLGTLLWYYRQLQEKYLFNHHDKEFLVHFIRPSYVEFGYNILLSLGTNHHIDVDKLSLIYLLIYKIVSQTVIEKTRQAEKKVSSNYIFSIGHFLKHRISPVLTNLVKSNADLTNRYGIRDELQPSISLARTALFSASVLDLYGKALQKRLTKKDYAEFSEQRIKELELVSDGGKIIENMLEQHYLTDKDLNIKQLINEIVELIKTESTVIQPQFDIAIDWDNLVIEPFIKYGVTSSKDIFLKPTKEIYYQFLHELFKNISKSENSLGHKPEITYLKSEKGLIISRQIDESDARNIEAAGITYNKYSLIGGEEISGLSLMQHYLDVLGLGEISHMLIDDRKKTYSRTKLATRLVLHGITERGNGQN